MDERRPCLERQALQSLRGEGVEQLADGLDLLWHRRLGEQPFDLGGDREIGCRARVEVADLGALVVYRERGGEGVAEDLERPPPCLAENPNCYSHLQPPWSLDNMSQALRRWRSRNRRTLGTAPRSAPL